MLITDNKKVYSEFKFWKDYWTKLNKFDYIIFNNKKAFLFDSNKFFICYIEFKATDNCFLDWTENKYCKLDITNLNKIRSTKKKDSVLLEYNNDYFKFSNTGEEIVLENDVSLLENLKIFYTFENILDNNTECEISINENLDIFEFFDDTEKILEIPTKKIKILNNNSIYKIYWSDKNKNNLIRYIKLQSINDDILINQLFKTI